MRTTRQMLGGRIKELRRLRNLSQEQVAERVGIDPKHLSRIEVGRGFPSLQTLEKLARVLNVDLKDFFEFAHRDGSPKEVKASLGSLLKEADPDSLRLLVKIARAVVR